MSKTNYICILTLIILATGCTKSPKQQNEVNATTDTELTKNVADTIQPEPKEIVVDEIIEEPTAEVKKQNTSKSTPTDNDVPEEAYPSGSMMVNNSYLIIQSTTSYSAAMFTAKEASEKMGHKLDLRGYVFDFKAGLRDTAVCGCGEIHEYVPRGRYDDGNYVSIEHTNSFTEFTDGYYIVVVASGQRAKLKPVLAKAKAFYSDAYIKDAEVYIGCLH